MAANDYYSSFNRKQSDPLPPLPSSTPAPSYSSQPHQASNPANNATNNPNNHDVSPVTSPFADQSYPTTYRPQEPGESPYASQSPPNQDYAYHGAAGGPYTHNNGSDPFADQNAIPLQSNSAQNLDPTKQPSAYAAAGTWDPENPDERRRRHGSKSKKKKKGMFSGRVTWVVWILTAVQCGVFVGELIKNAMLTKSPIAIKPTFNFMIGPSTYVLINMGARYQPCMHNVRNVTDANVTISWMCPDSTSNTDYNCTLSQACGMGGVPDQPAGTNFRDRSHEPNQWWRFIVPIFLHAGLIHIGFNMALQLTLGRDMEKQIGSLRFAIVYFSSGIFGFVLGGNYAAPLIASTGASGSLFGILALTMLDLLYNWSSRRSPMKDLLFLLLDVAIAFVLGLLPGLDNFSHIGGFLMGLVLGVCIMHSPAALRKRTGEDDPPYSAVAVAPEADAHGAAGKQPFMKKPIGFFKGRKPLWWAWWLARAGALVIVLVGFILLINNFYVDRKECSWCYHLTCLPISNWCEIGKPNFQTINETTKRDLFGMDFSNPALMPVPLW